MREPHPLSWIAVSSLALLAACSGGVAPPGGVPGTPAAGTWRPFAASSPWNTRIPDNPALDPDSAALIEDFWSSSPWGPHLDVNIAGYSIPLYWADSYTAAVTVTADLGGQGWTPPAGQPAWDSSNATALVPFPAGAVPDPQSDHHFLVADWKRGIEWGCWNMRLENGGWRGGVCATSDLNGSGVRPPATSADPWYLAIGARACGYPLIAGLIRREEIEAGRIDHALVVAYPHIRAGYFVPPASTAQGATGEAIETRGIPCGGRIQLDPALDLDSLGLSRSGRIIAQALQEYGAYVGDYSGALSLYAENSAQAQAYWAGGVLDSYELLDKLPLTSLRVIEIGAMLHNGNGG